MTSPWKDGRFHVNTRDTGEGAKVVFRVPRHGGGHVEHVLEADEAARIALDLLTCAEAVRRGEKETT